MCRPILRIAPWMTGYSMSPPPQRQLVFFNSVSKRKASSLLRLPRSHQQVSPYTQFHGPEQTIDSISTDCEYHPPPTPFLSRQGTHVSTGPDPHAYTTGRWLHRDRLERELRYIAFDFDALCRRVIELCPRATSIATCEKKEGGFNRIFIFTTNNAQRIVARLPFTIAGPPRLMTNSEVGTIKYRECKSIHQSRVISQL